VPSPGGFFNGLPGLYLPPFSTFLFCAQASFLVSRRVGLNPGRAARSEPEMAGDLEVGSRVTAKDQVLIEEIESPVKHVAGIGFDVHAGHWRPVGDAEGGPLPFSASWGDGSQVCSRWAASAAVTGRTKQVCAVMPCGKSINDPRSPRISPSTSRAESTERNAKGKT